MNIKQQLYKIPVVRRLHYKYNEIKNKKIRQQNIAMMHIGRVGSTVIGDMMNQHPDIFWDGEPFEKLMNIGSKKPNNFVKKTITQSMNNQASPIYCFATKFMPEQHLWEGCINMDLESYIKLLRRMKFDRYIFIKRENYLRQLVSVLVGRKKKEWHSKNRIEKVTKIKIDINDHELGHNSNTSIVNYFKQIDAQYTKLEKLFNGDEILKISYEKHIEKDPFIAYNKITDFITIEKQHPKVKYKKTNPFLLADIIENYEEVKLALQSTEYNWMLEN